MEREPTIVLHVGDSKSGKSYALMCIVAMLIVEGFRALVLDRTREWADGRGVLAEPLRAAPVDIEYVAVAENYSQARDALDKGYKLVIVQPPRPQFNPLAMPTKRERMIPLGEQLAALAMDVKDIAYVIPEAHRVVPQDQAVGPQMEEVLTAYRHYGVSVYMDTQRLAALTKMATEQAAGETMRLFAMSGRRDLEVVAAIGGDDLVEAVEECATRKAEGERGWFVEVTPITKASGDYTPRRFGEEGEEYGDEGKGRSASDDDE